MADKKTPLTTSYTAPIYEKMEALQKHFGYTSLSQVIYQAIINFYDQTFNE